VHQFGFSVHEANTASEVLTLMETAYNKEKPYQIMFLDHLSDMDGVELIRKFPGYVNMNGVVLITSFTEWGKIKHEANTLGVDRFITKPLFPSAILDMINEIMGKRSENLQIITQKATDTTPDFSDMQVLLAEDIEINQEIFITLLEDTHVRIDVAENGLEAVKMFKENPEKYDIIIMDIQMPEMDGYETTRVIRSLDIPKAQQIPIIAMTANVFKEDVEQCIACGMNDHLSKPIDEKSVIAKLEQYYITLKDK
jgi:CheY-like chemotaxis protein